MPTELLNIPLRLIVIHCSARTLFDTINCCLEGTLVAAQPLHIWHSSEPPLHASGAGAMLLLSPASVTSAPAGRVFRVNLIASVAG